MKSATKIYSTVQSAACCRNLIPAKLTPPADFDDVKDTEMSSADLESKLLETMACCSCHATNGTPADVGLRPGDLVTQINDTPVMGMICH